MAYITFTGATEIEISLSEIAGMRDDDKWRILSAGAEVMQKAQRDKAKQLFVKYSTGALAESITVSEKRKYGTIVAQVSPKGKHPKTGTGKRMRKTAEGKRASGKYSGSNAEIAYYLEYGTPRMAATHWIEKTVEEATEAVLAAENAAWDEYLKNKGF